MPDDGAALDLVPKLQSFAEGLRHDRPLAVAFAADAETERALRDGLADMLGGVLDVRRGTVRAAAASLQKSPTPRILVVDVTGEAEPLDALSELSDVVEPDVCVLVVGTREDAEFYRAVTRSLGAMEYLAKPLTRDSVARYFAPVVSGRAPEGEKILGGRVVTVTGVRGGCGASTIAVNLAWHLSNALHRHTVLLDPDLYRGNAAFLLNVPTGAGLRAALEAPGRIDALLAERAAQPAGDRLHVLSGEERPDSELACAPDAAARLTEALRQRYNLVVADVPFTPLPLFRDLLSLGQHRVLVLEPSLSAVRDTLRLLKLPGSTPQGRRPVLVLNRVGRPGGLTRQQVEDALATKVDVTIPDLPRLLGNAATVGDPVAASRGPFRDGIVALAQQFAFARGAGADAGAARAGAGRGGLRALFRRSA